MDREDRDRIDVSGDPEAAERNPIGHTPGPLEEKENASAYANRTDPEDVTGLRPRREDRPASARQTRADVDPDDELRARNDPDRTPAEPIDRNEPI